MKTALVIMAAGIGSRFGGGIKQLEPVGPNGEIIMDFSIHDAIEAGFNKIVFIIRKDLEKDFREVIGERIEKTAKKFNVEIAYAFQEINNLPTGFSVPEGRTKPWGTGQAVLACKDIVNEPFVVINADDYYGKKAFKLIHSFLQNYTSNKPTDYCMAGFILKNTLSDNGGVTRGVCRVDENNFLVQVDETSNIVKTSTGAEAEGVEIDPNSNVSMNMWGLTPEFIDILDKGFEEFLSEKGTELKAEYLLPIIIDKLIKNKKATVKMLETDDKWFGVTYKEDKDSVSNSFNELFAQGVYKTDLFSDL